MADGTDATAAAAAAATAAATAAAAATTPPWHTGIDAEVIGHIQNKSWKIDDPKAVVTEAVKAARKLEQHFGVPADQLLKLPKDATDEAGWKAVHQRLGAPADAKEYDFTSVKRADGSAPDAALLDTLRATAASLHVPKDRAAEFAAPIIKHLDSAATAAKTEQTAKLAAEKTKLAGNWKENFDYNLLKAMEGARRLGIPPEAITALENQIGYASVMEAMRKIGAGTSEDTFHAGDGPRGEVVTKEQASARLAELQADEGWRKRLLSGDAATVREWTALEQLRAA